MIKLNILLLSLLVASAAGKPRSKGQLLNQGFLAQSGGGVGVPNYGQNLGYQAQQNYQPPASFRQVNPSPVPNSPEATFQVNPQTLEVIRQVPQDLRNQQFLSANPSQSPVAPFQQPIANPTFNVPAPPQRPVVAAIPGRLNFPTPAPTPNIANPSIRQEIVQRLIGNPPGGALLVGTNPPLFPLEERLISNYTKIRPVVTDTFRCSDSQPNYVGYGYYGDVDNDCQIFHVCLPWKQLYPGAFDTEVTYQFSFICPNQTVFSQASMTCSWKSEAIPCELSPQLYWLNNNFFRKVSDESGFGTRYAHVNEKLTDPIVKDYDDFNPVESIG